MKDRINETKKETDMRELVGQKEGGGKYPKAAGKREAQIAN